MFKRIVIVIIVCFVKSSSCACPETFKNATVKIVIEDGVEKLLRVNKCVSNNNDIYEFRLLSPTGRIRKGSFFNLTSLIDISLSKAGVHVIEPQFAVNTPDLIRFKAYGNQIETIENDVFNNLGLQWIYLDSNKITYIADGAFHGSILKRLSLNDNKLSTINSTWFMDTKINELALSYNDITSLHTRTFIGIIQMKTLLLEFNKIHYIAHDTFSTQRGLLVLNLSGNSLLHLGFKIPYRLIYMDVSFNFISSISFGNVTRTRMKKVSIHPNPWACKCLLRFWKDAEKLDIEIYKSYSLKKSLKVESPLCIAVNYATCDEDSAIADNALYKEYFKLINYDEFGKVVYDRDDYFNTERPAGIIQ